MKILLFFTYTLFTGVAFAAPEFLGTAPRWILSDMGKNYCSPVVDYYEGANVRRPPFTYFGKNDWSYSYICEKNNAESMKKYILAVSISEDDSHQFSQCSKTIQLPVYSPAAFYYKEDTISGEWYELGQKMMKPVVITKNEKSPMLVLEEEVNTKYLCEGGKWFFQ